jgi:response regulator RpfG family c-di-GMP phosphodiesterase
MALKGFLQSSYQNALNIDDVHIEDYLMQKTNLPLVKLKTFANNLQLIHRLQKEGKMDKEKANVYIENQKKSIRTSLVNGEKFNKQEVDKAIEMTVKRIIQS